MTEPLMQGAALDCSLSHGSTLFQHTLLWERSFLFSLLDRTFREGIQRYISCWDKVFPALQPQKTLHTGILISLPTIYISKNPRHSFKLSKHKTRNLLHSGCKRSTFQMQWSDGTWINFIPLSKNKTKNSGRCAVLYCRKPIC